MAFFKFRRGGDEQSAAPVQPDSVEAMRRRAKHRLIGAAVLVLAGVIGFPLMFDKQPRPIAVDLPIEIPDKNKARPLTIPAPSVKGVIEPPEHAGAPLAGVAPAPKTEEKVLPAPVVAAPAAPEKIAKTELKASDKAAEPAPAVKPAARTEESAKAQALLEGKDAEPKKDASAGRFVVQVGAFSDATRAREVRQKVEHAGLKTYTQVAETKDGRRVRVRVGPFDNKGEAEQAAAKIKKLDLPAAILNL